MVSRATIRANRCAGQRVCELVLLAVSIALAPGILQGAWFAAPQSAGASSPATAPELAQAKSLLDSGKVGDAERTARAFLQFHPDSAEAHFMLGLILFREIQARGADLSTRSYPASADEASFRSEKAKESLAEFTEGARHATPSAFDLKIVAFDYIMFSDYNDADKWLTRAAGMNPSDGDIWYNLARTKYSENRFAEAIEGFQKCLALDPKNEKAENNLGLTLEGLGRNDEAIAAYKQAIAWQADAPHKDNEPYLNLGSLLLDQDQPKEALTYLLQASSIPPDDAKIHERLGKTYSHLDQLPQAQAELEKAVALAPNVGSLHFMLGQVYRREGQIEKAKTELQHAEQLNGTHSSDAAPH
jgi:tetratricopeptide (TPR) repeat protein